MGRRAQAFPCN
uniref:Uncharacterized protein n=1 Tax=Arundo donax TaxID=35708 RepID=A0A0A9C669_ARUDO